MKKIDAYFYTEGKLGKRFRETLARDNEYLYSLGKYPTKIKKEDLPEYYIKFRSRVIWYMTGYLKTLGVVDIDYEALNINHLFKDDYLYISYKEKLKTEKNSWGHEIYINNDISICGNDIVPIVLAIKKYSNLDINHVKQKIQDKVNWYRENCKDDYIRQFGNKDIDIFDFFENKQFKY